MSLRSDGVIHTLDDAFAGAAGLWTDAKCHLCGKEFRRTADWVYRVARNSHHKVVGRNKAYYFCSYTCWRKHQQEKTK